MTEIFLSTDGFGRLVKVRALLTGFRLTFAIATCLIAGGVVAVEDTVCVEQPVEPHKPFAPDMKKAFSEVDSSELVAVGRPAPIIRDTIAIACGTTEIRHQVERSRAAANLGTDFNAEEVKFMLGFLDEKIAGQSEYNTLEFNAIKNDVSWALLHQDKPVEPYCNALVSMYRDKTHDYVWRDYCIQHMAIYCARLKGNKASSKPAALYAVLACLADAVKNFRMPVCGTALIGMKNLLGSDGMNGDLNVSEIALKIATNPEACNSARASAVQVAVELKTDGILKVARDMAQNGEDVLLRISAVSAVGKVGTNDDVKLLADLSMNGDSRISLSARRALKSLKLRNRTMASS